MCPPWVSATIVRRLSVSTAEGLTNQEIANRRGLARLTADQDMAAIVRWPGDAGIHVDCRPRDKE